MTLVKIFRNLSKEEQRVRLQERIDEPEKRWKFRRADFETRALFDEYVVAYEEAITQTSTHWAPWHVVPADRNWVKSTAVATLLVRTLERWTRGFPTPSRASKGCGSSSPAWPHSPRSILPRAHALYV
jgi:polyphosphate kinase 2 (PPK2 family)